MIAAWFTQPLLTAQPGRRKRQSSNYFEQVKSTLILAGPLNLGASGLRANAFASNMSSSFMGVFDASNGAGGQNGCTCVNDAPGAKSL